MKKMVRSNWPLRSFEHSVTLGLKGIGTSVIALLFVVTLLTGCNMLGMQSGGSGSDGDSGPGGVSASQNLKEMPDPNVSLPASLSGGSGTGGSPIGASAKGDMVEVSVATIPDIQAQGWHDVREAASVGDLLSAFVTEIREIAGEQDLQFDTVYQFGKRAFLDDEYDMGRMKLTGTDANNFTVWWYPQPFAAWQTHVQLDIRRTGDEWEVAMLITIFQGPGCPYGEVGTVYEYSYFNSVTEESIKAYHFDPADGSADWKDVTRSTRNGDGSITFLNRETYYWDDIGGVVIEQRVGWGNDAMGGVISTGMDGSNQYASKEFYDNNGGLIQQSWGESELDTDWISWLDASTSQNLADVNGLGLSEAPAEIYLFYVWDGDSSEVWVSENADFSHGNEQLSGDIWSVYYQRGDASSAGDALYNWNGESDLDADVDGDGTNESGRMVSFSKGYEVPAAETALGGDYYFRNQFPFKHLLPFDGDYKGHTIRREEEETRSETWGEETFDWTDYFYFIDVDDDATFDGGSDDKDVPLYDVWMQPNWTYDYRTDTETIVFAPFFSTTGTNLPSYFSVPDQSLVTTVESRIDDAYSNGLSTLSLDDMPTQDISGRPQFDDLKN